MKWIPIDKAKVKFGTPYVICGLRNNNNPDTVVNFWIGRLYRSETTANGVVHLFDVGDHDQEDKLKVKATHIAIITNPNTES